MATIMACRPNNDQYLSHLKQNAIGVYGRSFGESIADIENSL